MSPSVGVVWGDLRGCLMAVSLALDEFSVKLGNGTGSRGLRSRGRNRSCTPPARDKQNSGLSVSRCPSSGDVRNEHHWFMGDGEEKKRGYTRDFCGAQGHKSCTLTPPKKTGQRRFERLPRTRNLPIGHIRFRTEKKQKKKNKSNPQSGWPWSKIATISGK